MRKNTDISIKDLELYFLPVTLRVPLKFGRETLANVTCSRVRVTVEDRKGTRETGWGETPLSVPWVWPSSIDYRTRHDALLALTGMILKAYAGFGTNGHPVTIGWDFLENLLPGILDEFNSGSDIGEDLPWLAALVCFSPFDIACHDAFGRIVGEFTYRTYGREFMNADLSSYMEPAEGAAVNFRNLYPEDFIAKKPVDTLLAWHLVGGRDPLSRDEATGDEPDDGYPVFLPDWIKQDGLKALKIKLRGTDSDWDYLRLKRIGEIAREYGVLRLSADFNCTVTDPRYVTDIFERLLVDDPETWAMILYVEQPFPCDLRSNKIDVHTVSAMKPLFMDESAHDWKLIRLGRSLGWNGVALKTCKTQTGAMLSLSWARAHGMSLMVQDLTNPMLAQIPHVLLAAHAGTIMGVESNGMQFYPEASLPEAKVHQGMYVRRNGRLDLRSLGRTGFGYRIDDIERQLPDRARLPEALEHGIENGGKDGKS